MINFADYFFILLLLVFGAIIAIEDFYSGKIRNKLIITGLGFGLVAYIVFFVMSAISYFDIAKINYNFYHISHFGAVIINFSLSVVVAYLIWQFRLWSAGDAKFFILLSLILPLNFYSNGFFPYFPSSALLINIFVPIFLFLILRMTFSIFVDLRKFLRKEADLFVDFGIKIKKEIGSFLKYKKRIFVILGTLLLTFIVVPVIKTQTILVFSANFGAILAIFVVFYFVQKYFSALLDKIFRNNFIFASAMILISAYFILGFLYFSELFVFALVITIKVGGAFLVGLAVFNRISNFYLTQKEMAIINSQDLKPNMIIPDELIKDIENNQNLKTDLGDLYAEGLTREQAEILKKWFLKNNKLDIPIYRTFSFAPYIFIGAIITILLKQSILHLFLAYIR